MKIVMQHYLFFNTKHFPHYQIVELVAIVMNEGILLDKIINLASSHVQKWMESRCDIYKAISMSQYGKHRQLFSCS